MAAPAQQIRFCEAPDGVRIAYAVSGTGPPLLVSTCWLSHLQHDWESPVWRHFLDRSGGSPPSSATTSAATASPTGT